MEKVKAAYDLKTQSEVPEALPGLERYIILNAIDRLWQQHLYSMDALRDGVYLRSYGQKDPLMEYKNEAFKLFEELMHSIKNEVLHNLFRSTTNLQAYEQFIASLPQNLHRSDPGGVQPIAPQAGGTVTSSGPPQGRGTAKGTFRPKINLEPRKHEAPKASRNAPCPCGSGKKFKQCCGRVS